MFVHIRQCSYIFDNVRTDSTMFVHIRQCSYIFNNVLTYSTMFLHIRQCSYRFDNVRTDSTMFVTHLLISFGFFSIGFSPYFSYFLVDFYSPSFYFFPDDHTRFFRNSAFVTMNEIP